MPEPTTTGAAVVTIAAATATIPVLTILGIPLGVPPETLIAGFFGGLVGVILLNTVPSQGDTVAHLVRTTMRRMFVAIASSMAAGYLTPLALLLASLPDPLVLSVAFAVGGGAQQVLVFAIARVSAQQRGQASQEQGGQP